jgi:2-hydroxy-6-oxo-6-(2'-carboxyphenyl)-hexa-2,4-dienoate hydrolase
MPNAQYVDAGGVRTRFFLGGQGEPMILLHGSAFGEPCSAIEWDSVFGLLQEHFTVYAIDRVGQGFSANPKSDAHYLMGSTVQQVADFAKALDLKGIHIVGHSRGAHTACRFALEYPDLVRSLVIVDSSTLMSADTPFYQQLEAQLQDMEEFDQNISHSLRAHSWRSAHITKELVGEMVEIHALPKTQEAANKMGWAGGGGSPFGKLTKMGRAYFEDLEERQKETHRWIKEGKLKVPTLIVWGLNDPSAPLEPIGLETLRLIFPHVPRCEMHILSAAGHYCFREQPENFAAAVAGFIHGKRCLAR